MNEFLAILTQKKSPAIYFITESISLDDLAVICQEYDFCFYYLDGEKIDDKITFMSACSEVIKFPDYFSYNWDSFEDCLTDRLYEQQHSCLLFYQYTENFSQYNPVDWAIMTDILQSSIEYLKKKNILFYVLLH